MKHLYSKTNMTTLFFYFNKAYALLFLMINYIPQ